MTTQGAEAEDEITDLIERLERGDTGDSEDGFGDGLNEVTERLLAFGKALGRDVESVSELPFTEVAGLNRMSEPLYVRHDTELVNRVKSGLLSDEHVGLISPEGTGKSALREIVLRDLTKHDSFNVTHVRDPQDTTARSLYQTVIETAYSAGYSIDLGGYSQIRDGVPWATSETKDAMEKLVKRVRSDGKSLVLAVDELETLSPDLFAPLCVLGDAGVQLFLTGTPEAKQRIVELRGALDSQLRYHGEIDPFSPEDIAEYIGRSLAHVRGEAYDGSSPELFTPGAITDIHERTGGNPRATRIECRDLFTRAAFVWHQTGQDIDRIRITPALRHQQFEIGI
jgi:type II secretory pathway predicted ATPase ExeA